MAAVIDVPGMVLLQLAGLSAVLRCRHEAEHALAKALWHLLFQALCNAPYAVMLFRPMLWAQRRELVLAVGHGLGTFVYGLICLGMLPRPDSLALLACGSAGLPIQLAYSGLLVPWLMQMRTRPALVIHAWRVFVGNLPMSLMCVGLGTAVRDCVLLFACTAAVSVVGDLRCRRRWLMLQGGAAALVGPCSGGDGSRGKRGKAD
jgi:hypothetical protein